MTQERKAIASILLADDDEDDALVFTETVRAIDPAIRLEHVIDGLKLMQLLVHYYPDILFIDLDMPRKNGLECLLEIRNNPGLAKLPVVVFSSTTRPANIQTAYEMGADLYLIKTSQIKDYVSAVRAILRLNWENPEAIKKQYCINGRYAAFG
jgi:CheY-like chemotaxis protein